MSDYWQRRKAQQMFEYMAGAEETADQIAKLYLKASRYLEYEMKDIFERFRTKHSLSEAEAQRLLNQIYEPDKLAELKKLLAAKGEDKRAILTELESPAYRARIERLQQLNVQLDLVMQQVYEQEKIQHTAWYLDLASEAYYHSVFEIQKQTGLAFSFSLIDPKKIDRVINSKWLGENYSDRIWKNTQDLADTLKEELLVSLVTGRTERETAEIIANKFAVGASKARRLVRTESCYLAVQMDMESYKECGIEMYRFLATLDLKTSEMCRELDGKRFPVSEQEVGKNCPPMHPWCRSTTTGDISDEDLAELKRRAIDPETGRSIKVPANMDYRQWYQKYVAGKPKAEANEKKLKNYAADREQYEKYRAILKDDIPERFTDFQDMKYNEPERWEQLKAQKQERLNQMDFSEMGELKQKLGNREVRIWYKAHDEQIHGLVDPSLPLEQRARQACEMRNHNRTAARELMKDQKARKELDLNDPNKTFEQLIEQKMQRKGLNRDEAMKDILETATKTRKSVNRMLGLE